MDIVVYASVLEGFEKAEQTAKTLALILRGIAGEPVNYYVIVIPSPSREYLSVPSVFIDGKMISTSLNIPEVIDKYLRTILIDYTEYPIVLIGQSSISLNPI